MNALVPHVQAQAEPLDYSRYEGHTGGNWFYDNEYVRSDDRVIAEPWEGCSDEARPQMPPEEMRANGRLLADAPALLARLRAQDDEIKRLRGECERKDAALRKARELFAEYALNHMRKDPPDRVKAERNSAMARKIDAVLRASEDARATLTTPTGEAT